MSDTVATTNGDTIISTNGAATTTNGAAPAPVAPQDEKNAVAAFPTQMTAEERYLFDLNGYLVVRNVLTADEIKAANAAIDAHLDEAVERADGELRNAVAGTPMYGTGPGRQDLGRVLEWPHPQSAVFRSILAHPRLVPLFHALLGEGYRLDHLPFCLLQTAGAEGFKLHGGTVDCRTGRYNPALAYTCHGGQHMHTALLGVNVMLTDHNAGDGGFCVVPGSHKANFAMPPDMIHGSADYAEFIQQPVTKAGDVVLFSEGTVHGALPWTPADRQRRACLYRFAPANMSYGRSYLASAAVAAAAGNDNDHNDDGHAAARHRSSYWPAAMYNNHDDDDEQHWTDAQRAVLEPPYSPRLNRPCIAINDDNNKNDSPAATTPAANGQRQAPTKGGEAPTTSQNKQDDNDSSNVLSVTIPHRRSARKMQHDQQVFGTTYF